MPYPLESLNDERFQQLCQALLVKEFPGVQCFPVGQPDGGRDATLRMYSTSEGKFLVFQVKFVRNPATIDNPRQWLFEIVEEEIDKVQALVDRSAIGYYLLTNVTGSAHLDVGSIDKVQATLDRLGLPAACWWRDDIERRLDDAWAIKWAFPEVLSAPDFLRAIIESGVGVDVSRRDTALRAFLRDQYTRDSLVKFRQVDLQNRLLDLFVDVPIGPGRDFRTADQQNDFFQICMQVHAAGGINFDGRLDFFGDETEWYAFGPPTGAASFLLNTSVSVGASFRAVVLEGAPGQGKSTISQYICQVHRIRLLNEAADEVRLPVPHRTSPVRLPIKIDLRDFATWLRRENPFLRNTPEQVPPSWAPQLEPFIAALISHYGGGVQFTVDDLLAVVQVSAMCLVLDGLDEVADVESRRLVIDELVSGTQRLHQNCASLQVIVTSRPAAFSNSPGMPEGRFTYLVLNSLTSGLISRYVEQWSQARGIDQEIQEELRTFIKSKLGQPHIRELARNPMQLAILLSLLHTRGVALPEKRTALYDAYVDHFFARESEKSTVVRTHRDVILELLRYLAWVMHSEAEAKKGRGNLPQRELISLVESYLSEEERDPSLATQLFAGIVERVVVLVSRVQDSFEFEVQPLREYFAARFLFETAPLSTPGNELAGSRPDRFEIIARNPYWFNVARFFAGCYSKGEIPSLVSSLKGLCLDPELGITNHPRQLSAGLLSDWVFAQIPRAVTEVISLILAGDGFLRFTASESAERQHGYDRSSLTLADACGRQQLVEGCFERLESGLPWDYR